MGQLGSWLWTNTATDLKIYVVAFIVVGLMTIRPDDFRGPHVGSPNRHVAAALPPEATATPPIADVTEEAVTPPDLDDTRRRIQRAADAVQSGSSFELQRVLERMRLDAAALPPPGVDTDVVHRSMQSLFENEGQAPSEAVRLQYRADLEKLLATDPYADQVAYELGWRFLLDGEADAANRYFAQSIWANPDRAAAWYGLGVSTQGDDEKVGRLAVAETLFRGSDGAGRVRDGFMRYTLLPNRISPERFDILQAQARRLALHARSELVPADIEQKANQALPPEN